MAARGWWVLRWAGVEHVRVLDGGLRAWTAAGGAVARGDELRRRAADSPLMRLSPGHLPEIAIEEVNRRHHDVLLLDARDEAAYQAGHIPGSVNVPAAQLWTPAGNLRSEHVIDAVYAQAGVHKNTEVVVYCGGGVLSALTWMTLNEAGFKTRLYVGSWSQWHKHRERQIALEVDGGAA